MVKFGRKFFFDNKYSKRSRVITLVVASVIVVSLIIILSTTKFFQNDQNDDDKTKVEMVLRESLDSEVYANLPDITSYFEKLKNVNVKDISLTIPADMPLDMDKSNCTEEEINLISQYENGENDNEDKNLYSCVKYIATAFGSFDIKLTVKDKEYVVTLNIVDTTAPQLALKEVSITEGSNYKIDDFIESCTDNSKGECNYSYYYQEYEDNNKTDYDTLSKVGNYVIRIAAADNSGNLSLPVDTKLTINAKPEVKTYFVYFDSNGGSEVAGQNIVQGSQVAEPAKPTKSGYTFKGWYLGSNKYDFNSSITNDITLIAKWEKKGEVENPTTVCTYGSADYNSSKYIVALFVKDSYNCAAPISEFNGLTLGGKANIMVNKEISKLKTWTANNNIIGLSVTPEAQAVMNNSGKGFVGYALEFVVTQTVNGKTVDVARYYIDTNYKRHFSLNTINLPES